jgi:transposase
MDSRQIKGLQIAQNGRITQTPKGWIVPSQTGNGSYLVYKESMRITKCTCPDCELRGVKCKHQWAVDYFLEKTIDAEGNIAVTKTIRMTYPQDWKAYNTAQNSEITTFDRLLKDLVENVPEPMQTMGRPKLSLKETLFCSIQKVYSQLSSRRAYSLYKNAQEREQIGKAPNYNSINLLLNREDITPILHKLLILSALPLKSIETTFAQDSSGFRTSQFNQYAVEKYGVKKKHQWLKAHILVGTKTNVIANANVTEEYANDCPQFKPLVVEAHNNGFQMNELVADMGYLSRENYETAEDIGAKAYIPFKKNATARAGRCATWKKMYHYFQLNREEFMQHYHARSNVESTFNMIKAKFGDKLKSKNWTAQKNELLCKLIAHNIVVLIHEMFELKIQPHFC